MQRPVGAGHGQPVEPHPEDEHREQGENEVRNRLEDADEDPDDAVQHPVGVQRGDDTDRCTDAEGGDEGRRGQQERVADGAAHQVDDSLAAYYREAEVATEHVGYVVPVLFPQRVVEPQVGDRLLDRLFPHGEGIEQRRDDIARRRAQRQERDYRDQEDDTHSVSDTLDHVLHVCSGLSWAEPSAPGPAPRSP